MDASQNEGIESAIDRLIAKVDASQSLIDENKRILAKMQLDLEEQFKIIRKAEELQSRSTILLANYRKNSLTLLFERIKIAIKNRL